MAPVTSTNIPKYFPPRIVLVTDKNMLKPSLFTAWTLMQRFVGHAELHIWGDGLSDEDWSAVSLVCSGNSNITLHTLQLNREELAGASPVGDYISAAAMGRLIIPSKLSGRVLYLDGDVRVTADLSPIFSVDMQGQPLAAVRDYVVSSWLAKGVAPGHRNEARLAELEQSMHGTPVSNYFNSGVLLLDADAIVAESPLFDAMKDLERASKCSWGDQDHLNNVFAGRVRLLDPAYNSSWSRTSKQREFITKLSPSPSEIENIPDAVIHFHGPKKPWKNARRDLWSRRGRAVFSYRRELAKFAKNFPNLAF